MHGKTKLLSGGSLFSLLPTVILCLATCPAVASSGEVGVRYRVEFSGDLDKSILNDLKKISDTVRERDRFPATTTLLRRRAEDDVPVIRQVLKSHGYYDSEVEVDIDPVSRPVLLTFRIDPGPRYRLESVRYEMVEGDSGSLELPDPPRLGLSKNEPARARPVLDARAKLLEHINERGYPFARIDERVVVNHVRSSMAVAFWIDTGPLIRLGDVDIRGLETLEPQLVRNRMTWTPGDRYEPAVLGRFRSQLIGTNLFSVVRVTLQDTTGGSGTIPVTVELRERDHRTIGLGGSYASNEGFGAKIDWEHRNLLGGGERLRTDATISEILVLGGVEFRELDFLAVDQILFLNLELAEDRTDVYRSLYLRSSFFLERVVTENTLVGAGISYRIVRVEQLDVENRFRLLSVPFRFSRDVRNDILDPVRGNRIDFEFAPYYDVRGSDTNFWKGYVKTVQYVGIMDSPRLVLAMRVGLGFSAGGTHDEIPADERFYAGGGGSIRGYPYLTVSPLAGDDPVGGRSLVELSAELRLKFTKSVGVVAFVDGGSAFEAPFPDFEEKILWATGFGFRYYTGFGPIRFDIGFPLDRRERIDGSYQIYVSLGQAY